jgi:hypothetical protein
MIYFYDNEGTLVESTHAASDRLFHRPESMLSNETLAKLEENFEKEGVGFPVKEELNFCKEICYFCGWVMYPSERGEGDGVEMLVMKQQALRNLLKAFDDLDRIDRETLLEAYMYKADLIPRSYGQIRFTSRPNSFREAAMSLLIGGRGQGRKSSHEDQCRKKLFVLGYELFLKLGLTPTIANGGLFGRFMGILLNDPSLLKYLGLPPENKKKLIEEAKKTVELKAK